LTPLPQIETYFKEHPPTEQPTQLDACTRICSPKQFLKTHFRILKKNPGNRAVLPYYLRLEQFYKNQKSIK
jgi:hypothetical protein